MKYLGLGKTLFNSGVCLLQNDGANFDIELLLTERLTRKKSSGMWPEEPLKELLTRENLEDCLIAENRDVVHTQMIEDHLNERYPFFDRLQSQNLERFSSRFNKNIRWTSHHLCHAYAALVMSPFEKSLILVMDGAGSNYDDLLDDQFEKQFKPINWSPGGRFLEEHSVYTQNRGEIRCVQKNWQTLYKDDVSNHWFSEGLGTLYEKAAEFIFNEKTAAGKVMGLAALGRPSEFKNRTGFLGALDWSQAFTGKGKSAWEDSAFLGVYSDLAASVQAHFEASVLSLVEQLKRKFPDYDNLILVGGCALNCTTNMKIFERKLFSNIYIPPFPGDESISLGAAGFLSLHQNPAAWRPREHINQHGYFGSRSSIPRENEILNLFQGFTLRHEKEISSFTAQLISKNKVVGWYQGRSETGPRALGHRSILARADLPGIKNRLNEQIKMRENFRPYGCSTLHEIAHQLFKIPLGFNNPFMSFAVQTQPEFKKALREVTHFDGTSRMQTVRAQTNERFYSLIEQVGRITGVPCVLNTSLNIMGEPIVESLLDAKNFLLKTPVDGIVIGDFFIERPRSI